MDFCHHVHNIAKCFTKPFENLLVNLFSNIYTDFNYRSYSREVLASICDVLFFVYTKPPNFVSWRWLSVCDVVISFNYLRIANMVFFTTYFLVRKVRWSTNILLKIFRQTVVWLRRKLWLKSYKQVLHQLAVIYIYGQGERKEIPGFKEIIKNWVFIYQFINVFLKCSRITQCFFSVTNFLFIMQSSTSLWELFFHFLLNLMFCQL